MSNGLPPCSSMRHNPITGTIQSETKSEATPHPLIRAVSSANCGTIADCIHALDTLANNAALQAGMDGCRSTEQREGQAPGVLLHYQQEMQTRCSEDHADHRTSMNGCNMHK